VEGNIPTQVHNYHMTRHLRKISYWALLTQAPHQATVNMYLV